MPKQTSIPNKKSPLADFLGTAVKNVGMSQTPLPASQTPRPTAQSVMPSAPVVQQKPAPISSYTAPKSTGSTFVPKPPVTTATRQNIAPSTLSNMESQLDTISKGVANYAKTSTPMKSPISDTQKMVTDLEKRYASTLLPSQEQTKAQEDLDNLVSSFRTATTNAEGQVIPLNFITGQQESLQKQALRLAEPLEQKLQRLQAQRLAEQQAAQFGLERADIARKAETDLATQSTKDIQSTLADLVSKGATQAQIDEFLQASQTGGLQAGLGKAAGFGLFAPEVETQVVEAGGRQLLINTRTGETIRDLGSSTTTGGTGGFSFGNLFGGTTTTPAETFTPSLSFDDFVNQQEQDRINRIIANAQSQGLTLTEADINRLGGGSALTPEAKQKLYGQAYQDLVSQEQGAFTQQAQQSGGYSSSILATSANDSDATRLAKQFLTPGNTASFSQLTEGLSGTQSNAVNAEISRLRNEMKKSGDFYGVMAASAGAGKDPSETFIQSFAKGSGVIGQLTALQSELAGQNTGPIIGALRNMNPYDVDAGVINARLTAIVPTLARGVYGEVGVLTDEDVKRYVQTLPNLRSQEEQNKLLLAMTIRTTQRMLEEQIKIAAASNRDVSGYADIYTNIKAQADAIDASLGINNQGTQATNNDPLGLGI